MILELGLFFLCVSAVPYLVYLLGIKVGKKMEPLPLPKTYPSISVVISAYNEEKNLEERFKNLVATEYTNIEIVFVDDCSTDSTAIIAKYYLDKYYSSNYTFIHNEKQMGTSASYNRAILKTKNEIVVVTDADVIFGKEALQKLIARLTSSTTIGAVTGDLQPLPTKDSTFGLEQNYRSVYWKMCDWESAIDSTFNFNGAIMAFKKQAVIRINDKQGADDANIAFATIRNGYRAVYEREAIVYETIPTELKSQYRQKVRRAALLIDAIIANHDFINSNRPFARFFTLRAWMYLRLSCHVYYGVRLIFPNLITSPVNLHTKNDLLTNLHPKPVLSLTGISPGSIKRRTWIGMG